MSEIFYSPSNTSEVDDPVEGSAIAETLSDPEEEILQIKLVNLDPTKIKTIAQSLADSYTTITVDGVTYDAGDEVYHRIVVHPFIGEDGAGQIEMMYGKPQFTINAFSDSNTVGERSIGYLWQVPKPLGQDIIDAWDNDDATGRSASATYNPSSRLLNIVLSSGTSTENLTTKWIQESCDVWRRRSFVWGYTKANLGIFLAAHMDAVGTAVGDGVETSRAVRTREVEIRLRGDGGFDAIITEMSFGPHWVPDDDPNGATILATAAFTITLPVGTKVTNAHYYWYNLNKAEITDSDFKDLFDESMSAYGAGVSVEFSITRQDDCSFDVHALVHTVTHIDSQSGDPLVDLTAEPSVEGLGIEHTIRAGMHATASELQTAIAEFATAQGVALQLDVRPNDDETFSYVIKKQKEQAPIGTATIAQLDNDDGAPAPDAGVGTVIMAGKNRTLSEMQSVFAGLTATSLVSYSARITPNGDGAWDYVINQTTEMTIEGTKTIGDSTLYYGLNAAAAPVVELSAKVLRSSSISPTPSGGYNYAIISSDLGTINESRISTTSKNKRRITVENNADSVAAMTDAKLLGFSASLGQNGKVNYSLIEQALEEVTTTATDEGSGVTTTTSAGLHSSSVPAPESERLVTSVVSISPEEDGTFSWSKTNRTVTDSSTAAWLAGSVGIHETIKVGKNDAPGDLDTILTDWPTAIGNEVKVNARYDDAGNVEYVISDVQKVEQFAVAVVGDITNTKTITHKIGDVDPTDADLAALALVKSAGTSYEVQIQKSSDGSKSYVLVKNEASNLNIGPVNGSEITLAVLKPAGNANGYTDKIINFVGVMPANLPDASDFDPDATYYFYKELTLHPNGTYSGSIVKRAYDYIPTMANGSFGSSAATAINWGQYYSHAGSVYQVKVPGQFIEENSASLSSAVSGAVARITSGNVVTSISVSKISIGGYENWLCTIITHNQSSASKVWELDLTA